MLFLLKEERELIESLRAFGVLKKIEGHRINRRNGLILVCCPDGDQFHDIYEHQCGIQLEQRHNPRIHPLLWNGGAMVCAEHSPINRIKDADLEFLGQISDARAMKQIDPIILMTHAPCGAARHHKIKLITQLSLHMQVKTRVRNSNPGAEVTSYFHVDFGESQKYTFFFDRPVWEEWLTTEGLRFAA